MRRHLNENRNNHFLFTPRILLSEDRESALLNTGNNDVSNNTANIEYRDITAPHHNEHSSRSQSLNLKIDRKEIKRNSYNLSIA